MDASELRGFYTFNQLNRLSNDQLQAIGERLSIRNRKNLDDVELAAEIMYKQPKIREEDAFNVPLDEADGFVDAADTSK